MGHRGRPGVKAINSCEVSRRARSGSEKSLANSLFCWQKNHKHSPVTNKILLANFIHCKQQLIAMLTQLLDRLAGSWHFSCTSIYETSSDDLQSYHTISHPLSSWQVSSEEKRGITNQRSSTRQSLKPSHVFSKRDLTGQRWHQRLVKTKKSLMTSNFENRTERYRAKPSAQAAILTKCIFILLIINTTYKY